MQTQIQTPTHKEGRVDTNDTQKNNDQNYDYNNYSYTYYNNNNPYTSSSSQCKILTNIFF